MKKKKKPLVLWSLYLRDSFHGAFTSWQRARAWAKREGFAPADIRWQKLQVDPPPSLTWLVTATMKKRAKKLKAQMMENSFLMERLNGQ